MASISRPTADRNTWQRRYEAARCEEEAQNWVRACTIIGFSTNGQSLPLEVLRGHRCISSVDWFLVGTLRHYFSWLGLLDRSWDTNTSAVYSRSTTNSRILLSCLYFQCWTPLSMQSQSNLDTQPLFNLFSPPTPLLFTSKFFIRVVRSINFAILPH